MRYALATTSFSSRQDVSWSFNGATVCDGTDPEGNVVQFREQSA